MKRAIIALVLLTVFLIPIRLANKLYSAVALPSLEASYVPSAIKSITPISIAAVAGTSNTQTVSVNASNSLLVANSNEFLRQLFECSQEAVITNGTTITATWGAGTGSCSPSVPFKGTLLEFFGNFVKSQGSNTITIASGNTSNTATITSVNTAKVATVFTGFTAAAGCTDSTSTANFANGTIVQTYATTITASVGAISPNGCNYSVAYSYLEYR